MILAQAGPGNSAIIHETTYSAPKLESGLTLKLFCGGYVADSEQTRTDSESSAQTGLYQPYLTLVVI